MQNNPFFQTYKGQIGSRQAVFLMLFSCDIKKNVSLYALSSSKIPNHFNDQISDSKTR
jgi:hypothetical protein